MKKVLTTEFRILCFFCTSYAGVYVNSFIWSHQFGVLFNT